MSRAASSWTDTCVALSSAVAQDQNPADVARFYAGLPVSADSPLAKVEKGMTEGEVMALLGAPKSQDTRATGKARVYAINVAYMQQVYAIRAYMQYTRRCSMRVYAMLTSRICSM